MLRFIFFAAVLQCTISQQYQQKVAPGVPPQNYQNYQQPPPPQQQYQQPPPQQQQYQQQQQQYQQPPPQQQQFQQQQIPQQAPVQPAQAHAHHDPQLLNPANIAKERDHIQEHLDVPIDASKMTEQEIQFHYFKMHDSDNNNKLDGCELIKSLIHWHGPKDDGIPVFDEKQLENIADVALKEIDFNNDGYISWAEYKTKNDGDKDTVIPIYKDEDIMEIVEGALKQTDFNNDGFIEYHEFKKATML